MERGEMKWVVVATMLIFDAIVGIAVAALINPLVGAIAFVVSASISLFTSRVIRVSGGRAGADAPEPAEVTEDPSYNPYAKED